MKLKTLNNVEEGELFFAFASTCDGPDLRSYFKGKMDSSSPTKRYHCECSTGDKYQTMFFSENQPVWA